MIISFGWTTPALLAGRKTRTRRVHTARTRYSLWHAEGGGELVDAWNTGPRNVRGNPHKIAELDLRWPGVRPDDVVSGDYPDEDWDREGFAYMQENGLLLPMPGSNTTKLCTPEQVWETWRRERPVFSVYDFDVFEYLEGPLA